MKGSRIKYLQCLDDTHLGQDARVKVEVNQDGSKMILGIDAQRPRLSTDEHNENRKVLFSVTYFTDVTMPQLDPDCPFVVNHGVSISLLEEFKREVVYFFKLSLEDKKKLWQQPDNHEGFGQLFVVSEEQKLDWSDMFYITTLPTSLRRTQLFDLLPPKLRETMEAYSAEVKKLAMIILSQMAKALKMDNEEMKELFSDGVQSMRMNYYPPCPEPDMAIGFTPHSDAVALTILYQLNDTQGLQIRKEGKWVPVKPLQDAFVVNIGDIMEIVSNGVYRSIEHRAMVNSRKERMSIATFYSTNLESELGPARSLIGPNKPAVFRRVLFEKYFKDFFARKLKGKSNLDFMKIETHEEDGSKVSLILFSMRFLYENSICMRLDGKMIKIFELLKFDIIILCVKSDSKF
ncbi:hypothetical protein HYC85_018039 [Camellia sinensis]|uniref:Fe2OG dioxygenase domain-containing protein n=1 Tax=Camellia sinensis TaxID=4442 RepID=A0A7J7GT67_CAMSI|nr:hypothetical protein HYC85_018039 [Camellia sinensis]